MINQIFAYSDTILISTLILTYNRVASHASQNKMSLHNLSTVFGPTLIGPAVSPNNADASLMNILGMSDVMSQVGILYYYLEHFSADGTKPQKIARQAMSTDL